MNLPPHGDRFSNKRDSDRPSDRPSPVRPSRTFRYRLMLHRCEAKDLMFIVRAVMDLTHFGRAEATHRMWEAHHSGQSQVLETHFERGELYVEQFSALGLAVSLEPA